jgi:hypothetical protein
MRCIYCGCELMEGVRPAHVIPNGIGGRLRSITTVCNACNNSFTGIESMTWERLARQGACVGALRGDGSPITTIVKFEGSEWRVGGARMDERAGPPTERGRSWEMPALREDTIKRIVTALRSLDLPPEAMLDGRFVLEPAADVPPVGETIVEPIESVISVDRVSARVMIKAAIELLAHRHGDEARRPALERARRFARYDEGQFYARVDVETAGARLPLVSAPHVHGIELWSAGMKLHCRMVLFTEIRFVGTLTDGWTGPSLRCSYSFNVQDPWSMSVTCEGGDGATLANKSFRVRQRELDDAVAKLRAFNFSTSERRRMRAPPPSFKDLYPDVVEAMKKKGKS